MSEQTTTIRVLPPWLTLLILLGLMLPSVEETVSQEQVAASLERRRISLQTSHRGYVSVQATISQEPGEEHDHATDHEAEEEAPVEIIRLPEGGTLPQVAVDGLGAVHVVFFRGEDGVGNALYMRSTDGGESFSDPLQVNHVEGSVLAGACIRGPRMDADANGRVHVVWMGSDRAEPKGPGGEPTLLYTRLTADRSGFERERGVVATHFGLQTTGSVACGPEGRVYVVWHAPGEGGEDDAHRRLWLIRSFDGGDTFSDEIAVGDEGHGVSATCSIATKVEHTEKLLILYRTAVKGRQREMKLLSSTDELAETFNTARVDAWNRKTCPRTTACLTLGARRPFAAWTRKGDVLGAPVNKENFKLAIPYSPLGERDRRFPVLTLNDRDDMLMAWVEESRGGQSGKLGWGIFDKRLNVPQLFRGRQEGMPPNSMPAVFTRPDGSFVILY